MYAEDKENYSPCDEGFTNLRGSFQMMQKTIHHEKAVTKQPRKSTFGALLSSATNEMKQSQEEYDEKIAAKSLLDDASAMTEGWIQETTDRQLAKSMAERLEIEEAEKKRELVKEGEKAALRAAMEERARIRNAAQAKADCEVRDREFARKVILSDIDAECEAKAACEKDEYFAKEVNAKLEDEAYAEKLMREEQDRFELERLQNMLADEKYAEEAERALQAQEAKDRDMLARKDAELARIQQSLDDEDVEKRKEALNKTDSRAARAMQVELLREEHRRVKRRQLLTKQAEATRHSKCNAAVNFSEGDEDCIAKAGQLNAGNIESVATQWEELEADIEDVPDGICILLVLPFLKEIMVRALDHKTVEIEARRETYKGKEANNKVYNTVDNTTYSADFIIEGEGVTLTDAQLSYYYEEETGMVFVYVDSVCLTRAQEGVKQGVVDRLKHTFKRLFSNASSAGAGTGSSSSRK